MPRHSSGNSCMGIAYLRTSAMSARTVKGIRMAPASTRANANTRKPTSCVNPVSTNCIFAIIFWPTFAVVPAKGVADGVEGVAGSAACALRPWRIGELPAVVATLAATAATAKTALGLRTRFVDVQRSAVKLSAIQFRDCAIRFRVGAHLDESKPSRLAGITIGHDADAVHGSICLKQRANSTF